jgi:hypothetical protein
MYDRGLFRRHEEVQRKVFGRCPEMLTILHGWERLNAPAVDPDTQAAGLGAGFSDAGSAYFLGVAEASLVVIRQGQVG